MTHIHQAPSLMCALENDGPQLLFIQIQSLSESDSLHTPGMFESCTKQYHGSSLKDRGSKTTW